MPSVLDTLPKAVDPGSLGTGVTLQPTNNTPTPLSPEILQQLFTFQFKTEQARISSPASNQGIGTFNATPDVQIYANNWTAYINSIGRSGQSMYQILNELLPPLSAGFYRYDDPIVNLLGGANRLINTEAYIIRNPSLDMWAVDSINYKKINEVIQKTFQTRYAGDNVQLYVQDLQANIRVGGTSSKVSVFDRVFSTPFVRTFVETPISAITHLNEVFSNSPGDNIQPLFKATVGDVPRVDFGRLGIESGVNVVSNVGFAYGVQGISQGISAGVSASTSLPAGTLGPVSPGFWSSVGSGNFANAWQILGNTVGVATGGPSTFLSRQGGNLLLQGAAQQIVKLTGDVGKGILQLVTLDFAGALQTFTGGPGGPPGGSSQNQLLFGPTGGGGGGGGYLPSQQTGQSNMSSVMIPILGLSLIGLVLWYFLRKKV